MPRICKKKQQSMADGSADLDGFPVSEGETLNIQQQRVLLGFDLRRVGCARVRFPTPSVFLTTSFVFNLDVLERNQCPTSGLL
jgi:hypothetical protein